MKKNSARHGTFTLACLSLFGGCVFIFVQTLGFLGSVQVAREDNPLLSSKGSLVNKSVSSSPLSVGSAQTENLLESLGVQPQPFSPWNRDTPLPCFPAEDDWLDDRVRKTPTRKGFLFVESSKTDSTTGTGISLRIASSIGRDQNIPTCKVRFSHSKAAQMKHDLRIKSKSFLWSLVREPTSRAISEFFHYQVSWRGVEPSYQNFRKYFKKTRLHNKQLKTLVLTEHKENDQTQTDVINEILRDYDFLGVTERMDETAVALQMLLGLTTSDVMYLQR